MKFDDLSQPFWKWKKLEKFWVDANFYHGSVPAEISTLWPQLRTLDLYNNELSGVIPESLGKLTQLTQIQLQDNHLSGTLPPAVLNLPHLKVLRVAVNAELKGDVHIDELRKSELRKTELKLNYAYTGMRVCAKRRRSYSCLVHRHS